MNRVRRLEAEVTDKSNAYISAGRRAGHCSKPWESLVVEDNYRATTFRSFPLRGRFRSKLCKLSVKLGIDGIAMGQSGVAVGEILDRTIGLQFGQVELRRVVNQSRNVISPSRTIVIVVVQHPSQVTANQLLGDHAEKCALQ